MDVEIFLLSFDSYVGKSTYISETFLYICDNLNYLKIYLFPRFFFSFKNELFCAKKKHKCKLSVKYFLEIWTGLKIFWKFYISDLAFILAEYWRISEKETISSRKMDYLLHEDFSLLSVSVTIFRFFKTDLESFQSIFKILQVTLSYIL